MPSSTIQPSFAAGVLAPALRGREDLARYDIGLAVGKNVVVHPHGGVSNRPGTQFVGEVADSAQPARLVPFNRDELSNYILVHQPGTMQVVEDGAFAMSGVSRYTLTTPLNDVAVKNFDYAQSVDVMILASRQMHPQKLSHLGTTNWTIENIKTDPSAPSPQNPAVTPRNTGTTRYRYKVTAVVDGQEGFPSIGAANDNCESLDVSGAANTVTWQAVTGATEYNVYRERNGIFAYVGFTEALTFTDDNIERDISRSPPVASGVFSGGQHYPAKTGFFQQRLMFGGMYAAPETILGSRIGDFFNFTRSRTLRADDRIETTLTGGALNTIEAILPLRELIVFTSTSEFSVIGPDGSLPADNPVQTQFGFSGSNGVKPIVVEDTALFVDRTGRNVRDLRYSFEQDGYAGNDLTVFAEHFFRNKNVRTWAYAKNPDSVVWVVLGNGGLLSLTYKREHQVWAWTEHNLGGTVEDVAVVQEGNSERVYFLVRRTIGGVEKRFVERLAERTVSSVEECYFVDCGRVRTGTGPVSTVGQLGHLEGQTVVALADGHVVRDLVVSGGSVTLPFAATTIAVGLPFTAEIETLPAAIMLQNGGAMRGRKHKISRMRIQVENTRGIAVSGAEGEFNQINNNGGDLAEAEPLHTGILDVTVPASWNSSGSMRVRQDHPLPMTILALLPEISIGQD